MDGLEPTGQTGAPPGIEAPTEVQDTEMAIASATPPKPVGATMDSALARQAWAKKNLALVEVQLTAMQQKMEEARAEMALADKAVNEARQLAVRDTVIFADVELLVQALRLQPQQQAFDLAAREALGRMTDALTSMRAMQQVQQQEPTPITPMTPTVTQGSEPFQELQVTQEAVLREAMRQAENTAVGQSPQGSRTPLRTGERPWREVDGDRRGAPEQIRPGGQRQICLLLKWRNGKLDGWRRAQVRGEHRWPKLTPEKWTGKKRRWRVTPECRIGEAKKPGPPDRLKTCPMCGAHADSERQMRHL